jgi:hypothetical protein
MMLRAPRHGYRRLLPRLPQRDSNDSGCPTTGVLAPRYIPPISLILATNSTDYIAGLTAARYVGEPTDLEAGLGLALWVQLFAAAAARAARDAELFGQQIDELVSQWRGMGGAGEGIRTPTPLRAADFKSAAYAISPPRQGTSANRPESYHRRLHSQS